MSLIKRVKKLEGQQMPRPMLIGVRDIDGTVWAEVPGIGRETFADTGHFRDCAATLSMDHFCVVLVAPRRSALKVAHA